MHLGWGDVTGRKSIVCNGVVGNDGHLGRVADVVSSVSHDKFEVEAVERVEKFEGGAVESWVALEGQFEIDIVCSWRHGKDGVAFADALVNDGEPLALGGAELDLSAFNEGGFVIRQLGSHRVLRFMTKDACWEDVSQSAITLSEEFVDDRIVAVPCIDQELDDIRVDHRRVQQCHLPAQLVRTSRPHREDTQDSLVDGLVIAVLLHVIGVDRADSVVRSELLGDHKIECTVVGVLLSLDEIFDEGEAVEL